MQILQLVKTCSDECGIALFAKSLERHSRRFGIELRTRQTLPPNYHPDVLLLQYHGELFSEREVEFFLSGSRAPEVLFAHSPAPALLCRRFDGLVSLCPGMIGCDGTPVLEFSHPAWTPPELYDRKVLREKLGLPLSRTIIGTNGFLKFDRQFAEIAEALLPHARRNNWFVLMLTSPWRLPSPGLITTLQSLQQQYPDHFRLENQFLEIGMLNRYLQACNLLWCWTAEPSSNYASGVISDQYASGTRIVAADKQQHAHILTLPNVARASGTLSEFIAVLLEELRTHEFCRHDPSPVSWDHAIPQLSAFFKNVIAASHAAH
jgi:hypothetical protein